MIPKKRWGRAKQPSPPTVGRVREYPKGAQVNTRPAGEGGGEFRPLPDFLDSSKTEADIDAKLLVPFPASI